jgi:hypothetical protein
MYCQGALQTYGYHMWLLLLLLLLCCAYAAASLQLQENTTGADAHCS